jgi:hypothetical protein
MRGSVNWAIWIGVGWLTLCLPTSTHAQQALFEGFESPEVLWHDAGGDLKYQWLGHDRSALHPHAGKRAEHWQLAGDNGSYVHLRYDLPPARVIEELNASLWIRADRPGLQLLARVVLPRTIDPATNQPATVLVPGDSYSKVGIWQRLQVRGFPLSIERQARLLRTTLGPTVETHEAFVDALMVNAYGGPGTTHLWIDDLELTGMVPRRGVAVRSDVNVAGAIRLTSAVDASPERLPAVWEADDSMLDEVPAVRLQGNLLQVDNQPFFPRVVRYRGESFQRLANLGFNVVWLPMLPPLDLLQEAKQHNLWLVATPPSQDELTTRTASGGLVKIGSDFDRVLAWDLGANLPANALPPMRAWIKALRAADPRHRPLVCEPAEELRNYSRQADILVASRRPLGSSLQLNEYGMWLRARGQLMRPGTPLWTTLATEPSPAVIEQMALLSAGQPPRLVWQYPQLRAMVLTGLAAGVRGFCFDAYTSLDGDDAETLRRCVALELLNRELELIEPWTARGEYVSTAQCSDPKLVGVVLQAQRARLLVPLPIGADNQYALEVGNVGSVSFTVPGASEANDVYEISPAGLRPVARQRVTGGMRITLPDGDCLAPILMTQDPQIIAGLSRRLAQLGPRLIELQRMILAADIDRAGTTLRRAAELSATPPETERQLALAQQRLATADQVAATKDVAQQAVLLRQAGAAVRQAERIVWGQAALALGSPVATPFGLNSTTVADLWQMNAWLASTPRGPNRLPSGNCDSLDVLLQAGWRNVQHPQPGVTATVEHSSAMPYAGRAALKLSVVAETQQEKPTVLESAPVWVVTAPMYVEAGELLQISGWVNVPKPIEGSVDGLMIIDSVSGEAMADRVRRTTGWQAFTLYRMVPNSCNFTVTFALTGLGEAWIDEVTVQAVDQASRNAPAMRLPAVTGGGNLRGREPNRP